MKKILYIIIIIFASACQNSKDWKYSKSIQLGKITPIGFTYFQDNIWISDGDHNQIVKISKTGKVLQEFKGFERPMHISSSANSIFIPEYGSDKIAEFKNQKKTFLEIPDSLDAPAGIWIYEKEIAIADFYNHRILYFDGKKWKSIGRKGKKKGEFFYPTDVQITKDKIFVADAYNNRIQVLNKEGKVLNVIGENEKMNASTGLFVSKKQIFVTDFENNRLLIYNHSGVLEQEIKQNLNKPTDVMLVQNKLFVANYKSKNFIVFEK